MEALSPSTEVIVVEPADYNDHALSLAAGVRTRHGEAQPSFCDALLSPTPGEVTFPINGRLLKGALGVTDSEVAEAIRYAFRWLKLVIEPGGAVSLAALLAGKVDVKGKTVGVMLTGGNVDPGLFARILAGEI